MHRSASWTRGPPDDYFMHSTPMAASSGLRVSSSAADDNELPMYNPTVEMAKKEKSRRFAENAVHVIPFLLIICGFILWFFCNPHGMKGDSIATRIEGLTIEGDSDHDSDGTQTGFLPIEADSKRAIRGRRKLDEILIWRRN
ncbi:unnamed protein product [Linum tenue]|uniref:Transmembrane protein n=1 Tax=Linum tenue TaxID=586396 RepID=A0AAV0HFK1_9ROSI|nr:unnamed protein product [Linum tenue]CAI0547908.1 unnamed protein product [Linum tenue]